MSQLSFEQAPPISVPVRFFLSAPLFGILAGVLLIVQGGEALASRWAPSTLALTHLYTAGFMLQAMFGALLQFVPVAAGGNIWRPRLVAGLVHPALCVAVLLFATGFLSADFRFLDWSAVLFVSASGLFAYAVGSAVFRQGSTSTTITGLRLAIVSLVITVVLGALLTQMLQARVALPPMQATNVHAGWGLVGWAGLLLLGVGYFVIPMFQMTPAYPQKLQKYLAPTLWGALVFWSLQIHAGTPTIIARLALFAILAATLLFAIQTLRLQAKRKRKVTDPTLLFFRGAMASTVAIVLGLALLHLLPGSEDYQAAPLMLGILILHGVFGSAINGMLYKILPFALWMNLQQSDQRLATKVSTRKLLGEKPMLHHTYLHFLALFALLAATLLPILARPAGLLVAASYAWLWWNLLTTLLNFRRHRPVPNQGAA